MSPRSSRRTFAGIIGAALLVWGADASARVTPPLSLSAAITPSLWVRPEVPDPVSLLPRDLPFELSDSIDMLGTQSGELTDTCGLFLDDQPRLTLFDDPRWWEPPAPTIVPAWHTDKNGAIVHYDQIPRRWERPTDYGAYVYPVVSYAGRSPVTAGYDLDLPDDEQRRGTMRAVGHGGVDLPQPVGTKINMITLDHQLGDAKVVHVGTLFGQTVVTLHVVREGGERAHYLLLFGHLDRAAPALVPGQALRAGDLVGFVGRDSESPAFPHLHLEARRIRDGVDPSTLLGPRLVARDVTIATDPRNVLPMKPATRSSSCKERRRAVQRAALFEDLQLTFVLDR